MVDKPVFRREHMIHLEIDAIFGVSDKQFTPDQRNWNGDGSIGYKSKGRKRISFATKDVGATLFSKAVVDIKADIFKGSLKLPSHRPPSGIKLYPINKNNRTFIG